MSKLETKIQYSMTKIQKKYSSWFEIDSEVISMFRTFKHLDFQFVSYFGFRASDFN